MVNSHRHLETMTTGTHRGGLQRCCRHQTFGLPIHDEAETPFGRHLPHLAPFSITPFTSLQDRGAAVVMENGEEGD